MQAMIAVEDIDLGTRRREDYGNLEELCASLTEKGLITPIAVWKNDGSRGDKPYLLLAGGRRLTAVSMLGWETIPCRVYDEPLDDLLYREIELEENIRRKDLTWMEQVKLQKEINELKVAKYGHKIVSSNQYHTEVQGWSKTDTAKMLGVSPSSLIKNLQIADAMEDPALGSILSQCKTKHDATKLLNSIKEKMVRDTILEKIAAKRESGGMDKDKEKLLDSFIVADFFEGIKQVKDESIDVVEMDPPYGIDLHELKKDFDKGYDREEYNEIQGADYIPFIRRVLGELYRVMRPNSWLIMWHSSDPWSNLLFEEIKRAGFSVKRNTGFWLKPNGQTQQPQRYLANCTEPFFYAAKGTPVITRQGRSNVFAYNGIAPAKKVHPTERPVELIQDVLSTFAWPGARVLVPFLGSGNTLLAASNLGISAFGFELVGAHKDTYAVKVAAANPGKYVSTKADVEALTFAPLKE